MAIMNLYAISEWADGDHHQKTIAIFTDQEFAKNRLEEYVKHVMCKNGEWEWVNENTIKCICSDWKVYFHIAEMTSDVIYPSAPFNDINWTHEL